MPYKPFGADYKISNKFRVTSHANKLIEFVGVADHPGITSNHCRAFLATHFWQTPMTAEVVLRQPVHEGTTLAVNLRNPDFWVRMKKRTKNENMLKEIANADKIIANFGKIEERVFENKQVPGIVCLIYSAGDQMLRFVALKPEEL
jgi:hypothetical protein